MRFQLLGPVVAYGERGPVALGAARQRTVLAALLIEPGAAVSIEQLIERVWAEAPPHRARGTMHAYLSRLRTALGDAGGPALVSRARSYVLDVAAEAVDLHRFRALARAARAAIDDERAAALWRETLALWQGEPLADLDSDWTHAVAASLVSERLAAVLDRNDLLLRRGEHAQLLPELTADAAVHPFDERLAGQLMLALYRSGRQADALERYRLIRQQLVDRIGSDPGRDLQALHHRLLQQDPTLALPGTPTGKVEPPGLPPDDGDSDDTPPEAGEPWVAPAQLPADNVAFTGRAEPLRQLDARLGPAGTVAPAVVVAAIGGTGGIGKTALAVHWAHQVRDRFPGGQLYLNLRGFDPGGQAMSVAEALRNLLELLDVPAAQIPTSVEAQAALYRSKLAGTRTLVVLDNARDTGQVRPLIPGSPGCMVVVTSRNQLTGLAATEGAHLVRLDALTDEEAHQFLRNRLGAPRVTEQRDAVAEIVTACAGLPLALAIVAARAATRPTFPLSTFATELTDTRNRLEALTGPDAATDVRAVFSWSYDALTPAAARTFRLLGLHPGPDISLHAAASLTGVPAPDTRRLLNELADAHLITEHTPNRYVFHDLLRAYATEQVGAIDTEDDQRAAQHRMLDHYLHAIHAADRWLPDVRDEVTPPPAQDGVTAETFAGATAAQTWLTTELPVLLAAIDQHRDNGFDHHIQQMTWFLVTFLGRHGHFQHLITVHSAALPAARRRGDVLGQADIHRGLAFASFHLGHHLEAYAHVERALDLYQEVGGHLNHIRARLFQAWMAGEEGRPADALRLAELSLDAAAAADHLVLRAVARTAVGWYRTHLGDHEQAIVDSELAVAELVEAGELANTADPLDTLGRAHRMLGHHAEAISYYERAAQRCREFGLRTQEVRTLVHLGETHQAVGDHQATRRAWQRALDIIVETGQSSADDLRTRIASLR